MSASAMRLMTVRTRIRNLLYMWGGGTLGQLGNLAAVNFSSPVIIGVKEWKQISCGGNHTAAIRSDSLLFTWGFNGSGQLGDGTVVNRSSPVQIGSNSWKQISCGSNHTSAIRSDDLLFTWGSNNYGRLGDGTTTARSSPVQIGSNSWTQVSIGSNSTVTAAIRSDSLLFTWGANNNGNLGDGTTTNRSSPVQIGNRIWSQVSAGGNHTGGIAKV